MKRLILALGLLLSTCGPGVPAYAADGTPDQGTGGCESYSAGAAVLAKQVPDFRAVELDDHARAAVLKALEDDSGAVDHIYALYKVGAQNVLLVMTRGDCVAGTLRTTLAEIAGVIGEGA